MSTDPTPTEHDYGFGSHGMVEVTVPDPCAEWRDEVERLRGVALMAMSALSWCVGFIAEVGKEPMPEDITRTLRMLMEEAR